MCSLCRELRLSWEIYLPAYVKERTTAHFPVLSKTLSVSRASQLCIRMHSYTIQKGGKNQNLNGRCLKLLLGPWALGSVSYVNLFQYCLCPLGGRCTLQMTLLCEILQSPDFCFRIKCGFYYVFGRGVSTLWWLSAKWWLCSQTWKVCCKCPPVTQS